MHEKDGFWHGRRVLVTGHTGFKGSWLSLWLAELGAEVTGFALPPPTTPSLFDVARVAAAVRSEFGDIRDRSALARAVETSGAEVVFHCAAQALVRESYAAPVDTYATNVMGTVNLLEAIRARPTVRAAVIVTSDKCYREAATARPHQEGDPLGGGDPYSSSKACAELVTDAYRTSFLRPRGVGVATVRAGNVIGGGDWALDRLIPDLMRACAEGRPALIRYPDAVRPWQHVLDPLQGYLMLAEALSSGAAAPDALNFGPDEADMLPVARVADMVVERWGNGAAWRKDDGAHPPEAPVLRLDSARARQALGWRPRLRLATALDWTVQWFRAFARAPQDAGARTRDQIQEYAALAIDPAALRR